MTDKLKPLIDVAWLDACSDSHTHTMPIREEFNNDRFGLPSRTVGYLIHSSPAGVVLAQTAAAQTDGWEYRHLFEIPRGMITKIRRMPRA